MACSQRGAEARQQESRPVGVALGGFSRWRHLVAHLMDILHRSLGCWLLYFQGFVAL